MKDFLSTTFAIMAVGMFTLSGCTDSPDGEQFSEVSEHDNEQPDQDLHAHPTHGPHGGDLIELGNDEYHAELVHPHGHDDEVHHDDGADHPHYGDHDGNEEGHHKESDDDHTEHDHAGITIYILDGSAKNTVAIEAADVTLNLTHDGKPMQFKLAADSDKGDPEGKSSRFTSSEKALLEHFHEAEHIEGMLVLSIDGKSYRGQLVHAHDDDHVH